jgi:hypothetical protein
MPDWQTELETLLSQLHVSLDGVASTARSDVYETPPMPSAAHAADDAQAERTWELEALATEEAPADDDGVSAVRSELEATVQRVIALARAGRLDSALRDDVVFVLQALTRPTPRVPTVPRRARGDDADAEWHLASAAAVLRFCRIVLRLTHVLTREADG